MSEGTVLVTGGAGFIGSHVVDALVARGRTVRVLDCLLPAAHSRRPDYLNPQAEYVFGDVRDPEFVERCLGDVAVVSHQASMVGLGVDFGDVLDYASHNDVGTAALLLALHRSRFGGRLVLGSSMVVYGEGAYRCPRDGAVAAPARDPARLDAGSFEPPCPRCGADLVPESISEDTPPDPRNVYAATKLHQEHLAAAYAREHDACLVVLRYHNVYGARMPRDTPYAGVASIFRSAAVSGLAPRVFEDGRQRRDFVDVRDIARANVLALDEDAPPGVFNIASGDPHTVAELACAIGAASADAPRPIVTGEYRLGDVRHVFASIDRARKALGYEPKVSFRAGMAEFATATLRDARPQTTEMSTGGRILPTA